MGKLYKGEIVVSKRTSRPAHFELLLQHLGVVLTAMSFLAVALGFSLIWIYLQFIKMPDLFLPVLTSNPVTPIAIAILGLIASMAIFILLFLPAIVVWFGESMFKVSLTIREKLALLLSQIAILFMYAVFFSFSTNGTALLTLVACLLLISLFVTGRKRLLIDRSNSGFFVLFSGAFGLYWVYGLLFLFKEMAAVDSGDDLSVSMRLFLGLFALALVPILFQGILKAKTRLPKFFLVGIALLCSFVVIAVLIPHQTLNMASGLAGIRQAPQDARYYWLDEKYAAAISGNNVVHAISTSPVLAWKKVSDGSGTYIWGYKLFQLSEVTVLCPQLTQVNTDKVDDYNVMCIQTNSKDIRPMPRSFLPKM